MSHGRIVNTMLSRFRAYVLKVNADLFSQGERCVQSDEIELVQAGLQHAVGSYDCAAQIIANRADASNVPSPPRAIVR